ncbi:MAG TPA: phytanoyl-CoA dioxygenase family protein [Caldilineaceae bacterium]|nr:phytanoyl-CoA dioxygenase family protein [Caldilineaceae bacterium]
MKLSQTAIDQYHRDGVIIARGVLTDADLQPVIDELSAWIDAQARALHAEGKIQDLHEDAPFSQRYGLLFGQCNEIGKGMDIMYYRGPAIFAFLHNPNLLDAVEGLTGPEITCNPIQHLRAKPPERFDPHTGPSFHVVPWHQDAGVMMPEAEGSNVITCWLPLGDATVAMGCMEALPGVHKDGYLRHKKEGGTTIDPALMPGVEPVALECHKGDVVFMNRFTPHRSTPNKSDHCRWSLDLRYQTTGHHTGRTAHPDFVVRSPSNPASVMNDYDEWCRLWVDAFENPKGVAAHRAE